MQIEISVVVSVKESFPWKHIAKGGVSCDDEDSFSFATGGRIK